jgi:hypothetical protein
MAGRPSQTKIAIWAALLAALIMLLVVGGG